MNKSHRAFSASEAKIQAKILLKSIRSSDPERSSSAATRFQRLPEWKGLTSVEILERSPQYKHALAVIAMENGFKSWLDLKMQTHFIIGGYLNSWFAQYDPARAHLQVSGGYLFPYKNQFFICNADYVLQIGFDPDDPDWQLIEFDWAKPGDVLAWQRLYKKWNQKVGGRDE